MLGEGTGHLALPGQDNGLVLDLPVAGIEGLGPVALDNEVPFIPGIGAFLVFVVVVEEDLPPVALRKGPGIPGLRQGINHTAGDMEGVHEPVEFFPVLIDPHMDDPVHLPDHHMEVLALVDPHEAGPGVFGDYPLIPAEGEDLFYGQPVRCLHIGYPDLEVVEVGQVIGGPELVEDVRRVDEVGEELAVVVAPLVGNIGLLGHPLADGGVELTLALLAGPDNGPCTS